MCDEMDKLGNDFWLPLEHYLELGRKSNKEVFKNMQKL